MYIFQYRIVKVLYPVVENTVMDHNSAEVNNCLFHSMGILNIYCHDCKSVICLKCYQEHCMGHRVDEDLTGVVSRHIDNLQVRLQDFRIHYLQKLGLKIETFEQEVKERREKKDEVKGNIVCTAKQLKEEMSRIVDSIVTESLTEIDRVYVDQTSPTCTTDLHTEMTSFKDTTLDRVNKWEEMLDSDPDQDQPLQCLQLPLLIEKTHKQIQKADAHISSSSSTLSMDEIDVKNSIFSELRRWIDSSTGSDLEKASDAVNVLEKATIVQEICLNSSIVHMCTYKEGKAWVLEGKQIQLVNPNGQCLHTCSVNHAIGSMTSDKDGELLVTIPEKRTIMKITPSKGEEIMFIENTSNLIPCGIGIWHKTNDIVLGFVDKLDYSPDVNSQRLIRIYDSTGRLKDEYLGRYGERKIFVQPQRITVSPSTDHVAIINRTKQLNGEIITMKDGKCVSIFPEPDKTRHWFRKSFREKFDPRDVDFDALNNIVTCDYESKSIFLIHADFGIILRQYTCDTWPCCLTCMSNQNLWVGFAHEGIKIFKYLTYD